MLFRSSLILLVCLSLTGGALAMSKASPYPETGGPAASEFPQQLQGVGIDQNLGAQIPLDLVFHDEQGADVKLGDLINGKKPVILTLVYYSCPMLCTVVLNDTLRTMKLMNLGIGKDFTVVTVSFDPKETSELAHKKKQSYVAQYKRDGAEEGWHFLTGDADSIARLTRAVGFRYTWDPKTRQYMHASGITVLTPQGKISKYFFGIKYAPKDVTLALVEASNAKVGSLAEQILLYCFHYDPSTGRYSLAITRALKVGAVLLIVTLGVTLFMLSRNNSGRGPARIAPGPDAPDQDSPGETDARQD